MVEVPLGLGIAWVGNCLGWEYSAASRSAMALAAGIFAAPDSPQYMQAKLAVAARFGDGIPTEFAIPLQG